MDSKRHSELIATIHHGLTSTRRQAVIDGLAALDGLVEQLEAAQKAIRELHENMWTVSHDDGPEFVSSEGLKYLRSWFDRTNHLLGEASDPAMRQEGE